MKKAYRLWGIISKGTGTWAVNSIIPLYTYSHLLYYMQFSYLKKG